MLGWELPPNNSGGLGVACYQLCQALSKNDVDLEFVLPYQADHSIDFMDITAALPQNVKAILPGSTAYDSHRYVLADGSEHNLSMHDQQRLYEHQVASLVENHEVDIVHAHDWLTFRAALRVKELKGCPVIMHVHSVESDRAGSFDKGNPLVKEIERLSMHLADKVIAVSQHTKDRIIADYQITPDKIEVVHNSINTGELVPLSDNNAYTYLTQMKQLGYKVVVNVGRLTIQKGLPNLLKAISQVVVREPKTLLLIVGSGDQYGELIELAAELGIGQNVLFADFQRGKKWRDAFAIGDLFVMPSVSEPFGLTPLEAAGYGTPSLISKQSGVSEVLHACLKVDFWDVNEMANQIVNALRSDSLRDQLSQESYQEYQRLSWDEASGKLMNLYRKHASKPGAMGVVV